MVVLNKPAFHAIFTPPLRKLIDVFNKYSYRNEIRIVGGAVRDILCDKIPHDLDFATTITPDEMKIIFTNENIRMINENGEKHGTITARISTEHESANFEITTLRRDTVTDGRHATIEFTKDWKEDAARRDLTVNALYLDFDGLVYDYFNSIADLEERRVIFVGEPAERMREDYLRILRYFRFYGRIAREPSNHDEKTMVSIRENVHGLKMISGERIWMELNKIVTGNHANAILKKMIELGLAPYLGFPPEDQLDIPYFDIVCSNVGKYNYNPITFIVALLKTANNVTTFHNRVHLSCGERDMALYIVEHKYVDLPQDSKNRSRFFERLLICSKGQEDIIRSYILELMKVRDQGDGVSDFAKWIKPKFPVDGTELMQKGIAGKQIGTIMNALRDLWIDNEYVLNDDMITNVISGVSV